MIQKIKRMLRRWIPTFWHAAKRVETHLSIASTLWRIRSSSPVEVRLASDVSFYVHANAVPYVNPFMATSTQQEVRDEMRAFLSVSKEGKYLLDIGALFGVFSLAFTASDPRGKIAYAIEPSVAPFAVLKSHCKMNPRLSIKPFRVAFGDHNGRVQMKYEGLHMVAQNAGEVGLGTTQSRLIRLDDFVREHAFYPDVIKIDTEGSEYHIFEGGMRFLKEHDPVISLEIHANWLAKIGVSVARLVALVRSLGYEFYNLNLDRIENPVVFACSRPNCRVVCRK